MGNIKKLFYVLLLLVITSCSLTEKRCQKCFALYSHTQSTQDSTSSTVAVHERDSTIKTPSDSSFFHHLLSVDTNTFQITPIDTVVKSTTGNSSVHIKIKDNKLTAQANCDSLYIQLHLKDSVITNFHSRKETIVLPPVEIEKPYPWWMKIFVFPLAAIGLLAVGMVVGKFVIKKYS